MASAIPGARFECGLRPRTCPSSLTPRHWRRGRSPRWMGIHPEVGRPSPPRAPRCERWAPLAPQLPARAGSPDYRSTNVTRLSPGEATRVTLLPYMTTA